MFINKNIIPDKKSIEILKGNTDEAFSLSDDWIMIKDGTLCNLFMNCNGNADMSTPLEVVKKLISSGSRNETITSISNYIDIDKHNLESIEVLNGVPIQLFFYYIGSGIILPINYENGMPLSDSENAKSLIIGLLKARIEFFESFLNLIIDNDNYQKLFAELLNATRSQIYDILIRFCGFSMIDSQKTIITPYNKDDLRFEEYIDNGYQINQVYHFDIEDSKLELKSNYKDSKEQITLNQ